MAGEVAPWETPDPSAPAATAEVAPWETPPPQPQSDADIAAAGDAATADMAAHPLKALKTLGSMAAQAGAGWLHAGGELGKDVGVFDDQNNPLETASKAVAGVLPLTPEAQTIEAGIAHSAPARAIGATVNAADTAVGAVAGPDVQAGVRRVAKAAGNAATFIQPLRSLAGSTEGVAARATESAATDTGPAAVEQILAQPHTVPTETPAAAEAKAAAGAAPAAPTGAPAAETAAQPRGAVPPAAPTGAPAAETAAQPRGAVPPAAPAGVPSTTVRGTSPPRRPRMRQPGRRS